MTLLRIAIVVVVAFLVLLIGGCVVFGVGTSESGTDLPELTTPAATTP